MAQAGAELTLVYLTAGEAAKDTGHTREALARVRRAEAQAAGEHLGAAHVEVLDFPDGGLAAPRPATFQARAVTPRAVARPAALPKDDMDGDFEAAIEQLPVPANGKVELTATFDTRY